MDHMTAEDRECVFEELDFYQLEKAVTSVRRTKCFFPQQLSVSFQPPCQEIFSLP